ncbi:O-succinylbenzoyl-CoA synthetase [Richelia sinica FACHB-800]|uniref:O-succinylbenzoyl-CoA synthetase n=1 Tax=Richelia sinica FACHB-800 TaxID=1357546 RepID=A0A975Y2X4_9NOST|nr:2-succinylbenzoate--CoA ligase [Richelia sinica]MBD2667117.1 2-succinylbenzoate--CoA ligase [Richelia sinica FACHB-800]QXE21539.1 O-succinylbenzoyl-CoA synthetase [Richelia sinica FACHB-800]
MAQLLDYLNHIKNTDWLICKNSAELIQLTEKLYLEFKKYNQDLPLKIIIAERDPVRFLAAFIAACAAKSSVFICNPDWGIQEWSQVANLLQPNIALGVEIEQIKSENTPFNPPIPNSIMIPTGGSSGNIKFAIHTWDTLTASVQGFTEYFQIQTVNSFCVLPLYHVSGLMQFMRSFTTGGQLVIAPFKEIEAGHIPQINYQNFYISLVPTQLQRLFGNPQLTQWLSQFQMVMLGGAPAWEELLEKARFHQIRLAPTYGMTETASQIATLKPDDFLTGQFNSGQVLPHAKITIRHPNGDIAKANQIGNIHIQASSLTLGYYPNCWENQDSFAVDDLGFLDHAGYLHIVGRNSDKIISGGENIYPMEIEAAIRKTNLVVDVCVIGIPNKEWGQAVTALYIPNHADISPQAIKLNLQHQLSKFKVPKYWIPITNLPRNIQGKVNRQKLQQIAQEFLANSEN